MWGILRQNAQIQRFYMHFEVPTTRLEVPEFQGFRLPANLSGQMLHRKKLIRNSITSLARLMTEP